MTSGTGCVENGLAPLQVCCLHACDLICMHLFAVLKRCASVDAPHSLAHCAWLTLQLLLCAQPVSLLPGVDGCRWDVLLPELETAANAVCVFDAADPSLMTLAHRVVSLLRNVMYQ